MSLKQLKKKKHELLHKAKELGYEVNLCDPRETIGIKIRLEELKQAINSILE